MKNVAATVSHKRRTMEFSKKIFIAVSAINLFVVLFTCYMVFKTFDLSPLAYLIPAVAAEMATGTGFYYSKAKAENKIKLLKSNGIKPKDNNFIE